MTAGRAVARGLDRGRGGRCSASAGMRPADAARELEAHTSHARLASRRALACSRSSRSPTAPLANAARASSGLLGFGPPSTTLGPSRAWPNPEARHTVRSIYKGTVTARWTTGARTTRSAALGPLDSSLAARRSLGRRRRLCARRRRCRPCSLGAHERRIRPAHARHGRRCSVDSTARSRLVTRSASPMSALRSASPAPSRRCDPRHVRRRLRQPRDAAGARPHRRRVVLAARAPAAAPARLSDSRSACARPLGRALPPLLTPQRDCAPPAGLRPACRAPAGLWVGGCREAPSLPSGHDASLASRLSGREGLSHCRPQTPS